LHHGLVGVRAKLWDVRALTALPLLAAAFAVAIPAPAQTPPASAPAAAKKIPGFDPAALDRTANPCVDFYRFACGTWLTKNPIPSDQARWGRFDELAERNQAILADILEQASKNDPKRSANTQKIGDAYSSCLDQGAIDAKGLAPLKPELDRIASMANRDDLIAEVTRLHSMATAAMFNSGSEQDLKDATQVIAAIDQGGLGLPDRDYYLSTDAKQKELRAKYETHIARMFELAGTAPDDARQKAARVLALETALATASLDRVSRRNPANRYHPMSLDQVHDLAPAIPWPQYFASLGAPPFTRINVVVPGFFKELNRLIDSEPLEVWKTYLTWHVLHDASALLPTAFVDETFAFYGRTLTGAKEIRPRWKRCVQMVDRQLGEALGQAYVDRTFGVEGKNRTLEMVHALEAALARDIEHLDWMTPVTRQQALAKLKAVTNKIGYPEKWRDYSTVAIVRGDAIGNAIRASEFEVHRDLAKIGKPIDPSEWLMTPPTVNAYYDPQMNNINFPAGILQPPFFDKELDDAVNFGGIGAVIGHELTHGFDDQGRRFDAKGDMRDWWTADDAKSFDARAQCIIDEYGGFEAVPGVKLNGKLTLGENVADNGGLRIALMALQDTLARRAGAGARKKIDGFTPEQRLFLGWGQIWCQNMTDEVARLRALTDPHSPGRWRVNGVVENMPEFQKAFGCKAGAPMVSAPACRVW
jgi:putative endopeptidase